MKKLPRAALALLAAALIGCLLVPGTALAADSAVPAGTKQVWRLYNPYTGEHHYTTAQNEYAELQKVGWNGEGEAWLAYTKGEPVYRLYNPFVAGGDHHYTLDANERATLKKLGWEDEGIAWYSMSEVDIQKTAAPVEPLYRLYNPYAVTGTHHYTTSALERDALVEQGWEYEKVAWYGRIKPVTAEKNTKENALAQLRELLAAHDGTSYGEMKYRLTEQYGYSEENAKYALDSCGVDWDAMLGDRLAVYLSVGGYSRDSLIEILTDEGFDKSAVVKELDAANVNWNEEAVKAVKGNAGYESLGRDYLTDQLEGAGFTDAQIEYALNKLL